MALCSTKDIILYDSDWRDYYEHDGNFKNPWATFPLSMMSGKHSYSQHQHDLVALYILIECLISSLCFSVRESDSFLPGILCNSTCIYLLLEYMGTKHYCTTQSGVYYVRERLGTKHYHWKPINVVIAITIIHDKNACAFVLYMQCLSHTCIHQVNFSGTYILVRNPPSNLV